MKGLLSVFLFIYAAKNDGSKKKELDVPTLFSFLKAYAFILRAA